MSLGFRLRDEKHCKFLVTVSNVTSPTGKETIEGLAIEERALVMEGLVEPFAAGD